MHPVERYAIESWRRFDKPMKKKKRPSKRQMMLLKGNYRANINQVLEWMGKRDARLGFMPRFEGRDYLAGFSRQYAKEQILSNTRPF